MASADESVVSAAALDKASLALDVEGGALLRPLREEDVSPAYVDGLNDPRVSRYLVAARRQRQTAETVRAYVRQNWDDPAAILFGAFIDGALRGTVRLHMIDQDSCTGVMGIALFDPAYWGRGWGSRCVRRVGQFAVGQLGLKRIFTGSYRPNGAAIRCFLKAGFIRTPERDYSDDYGDSVTLELDAHRGEGHGRP